MSYHSDYQRFLFDRGEIASFLKSAGYPLQKLASPTDDATAQAPHWMRIYAAKSALRTYEAAWIMEGKEPPSYYPKTHLVDANERRNLNAINDSVLMGDIATKNTQDHIDDDPQTWFLDHLSVIAWCQRAGYEWPLAQFMQSKQADVEQSAGDSELFAQTASQQSQTDFKQEIDELREEVAELRSLIEELKRSVPLHPGGLMGKAIEVQHKYWQDPDNDRPKLEVIVSELKARNPELSDARARAIEAVACPVDRKK
ncbi:hypothetical protein ACT3R7_06680 [Halomonas sp. AOP43-A1-21]